MAPTITEAMGPSLEHLSLSHKLRKPVVEKLRRERINSSIEQLKSLLCAEFLHQQPDSKLEKADILEMTVSFLTRLQQQKKIHFASQNHVKIPQESHCTELHNQRHSSSCEGNGAPWRPWYSLHTAQTATVTRDHTGLNLEGSSAFETPLGLMLFQ